MVRILLALVVVVAAVVALLLWLPPRGASTVVEPAAVAPAEPALRAPLDLDAAGARTEPERPTSAEPAIVAAAAGDTCRVEIALVWPEPPLDGRAEVQCFDAVGRPMPCEPAGADTWLAAALEPGEYHVDVRPRSGTAAGVRFVVDPGERTKRVEVPLRFATWLRVRWQAADGQPIVAALMQPGILRGPAPLKVVLGTERFRPGDPAPTAPLSFQLTQKVQPSAPRVPPDPDPVGQPEERAPPWEGAPADAFGVLVLPGEPPCALNACIGGLVVDSADVLPDTTEVVFRTNVDVVRSWHTTLRFCAVAEESGEPVGGARYMVSSSGSGYAMVVLDRDGCCVDLRVLPGAWTLIVQASDRAPQVREITLAPGEDLDLGRIALKQGCLARALVRLPDGKPASGITALLLPVDRFGSGALVKSATAGDGIVTFTSVPDDDQVIVVVDDRWTSAPVLVAPCGQGGQRAQSVVQLEEGVRVALDFGPTSPLAPSVLVTDANGLPVARRPIGVTGLVALRLVPGEYFVEQPGKPGAHVFRVGSESVVIDVR